MIKQFIIAALLFCSSAFQLPPDSSISGYALDKDKISEILDEKLDEKLSPCQLHHNFQCPARYFLSLKILVKSEVHKIQQLLNGNEEPTFKSFPRFAQRSKTSEPESNLPPEVKKAIHLISCLCIMVSSLDFLYFPLQITNLQLNPNTLGSLNTLVSMFGNQEAVRNSLPPGICTKPILL